jgi:acyl-CoA synthetase (AMP-forming)/AMP-acid ligase II
VENALSWHPAVAEVTIVGRPDEKWGEVPVACIVPKPGSDAPALTDLRAFLDDRLARYKHPKDVLVLDALPRTGMGKIHKSALRDAV